MVDPIFRSYLTPKTPPKQNSNGTNLQPKGYKGSDLSQRYYFESNVIVQVELELSNYNITVPLGPPLNQIKECILFSLYIYIYMSFSVDETLLARKVNLSTSFREVTSSVEKKDIDTRLTKAWTAIDKLSIIWKSELTDKMKRSFFQAAVVSILQYGCSTWTLTKARRQLHKNVASNIEQVLAATPRKAPSIRPPTSHHENYPS